MDRLIEKLDWLENEVITLRPLKNTVASLENTVASHENTVASLENTVASLENTVASLEVEVTSLRPFKKAFPSLEVEVASLEVVIMSLEVEVSKRQAFVASLDSLLPMADTLAIRCLLDVFLHQQGYSQHAHGSRRNWVEDNKTIIGEATGIAEGNISRVFRTFRSEGDESAHRFKSDSIGYAITCITDQGDQGDLRGVFLSVLSSTVEEELDDGNPCIKTLKGGFLMAGEMCITTELKPV